MIALFGPLKNGFFGQKKEDLTPGANRPQKNTPTTETRFWMHWTKIHASQGKLWTHWRNQKEKKRKKTREGATSPICPTHPPFSAATIFCMCCRTADVITYARFQVNLFRGFGAPGGRKWPSSIDLAHRPYNSVRPNVLHCDIKHPINIAYITHFVNSEALKAIQAETLLNMTIPVDFPRLPVASAPCQEEVHVHEELCLELESAINKSKTDRKIYTSLSLPL